MRLWHGLAGLLLLGFLAACATTSAIPHAADLRREAGRRLYIARCSVCHNVFPPQNRTIAEWESAVHDMAPRAHLDPGQEKEITDYLFAVAKPDP